MKNKHFLVLCVLGLVFTLVSCEEINRDPENSVVGLRALHARHLENSPYKSTKLLPKKKRSELGLPPDRYMERVWELTMNPAIGRPTQENLRQIQQQLLEERTKALASGRVPGDNSNNNWVERGPNNVGGRTRALIFDPNDSTNETVLAGGVSGGLWRNTNISDPTSVWTAVDIPEHLNITCIAVDPNNTKTMYVGTGESYVFGDVNGNGVWKSVDGGNSWSHVFGGSVGETVLQSDSNVIVNSPSSLAGNYLSLGASFGPKATSGITGNLVLINSGGTNPNLGCNSVENVSAVNGQIAVIYRGTCSFVQKITNAQAAGAKAVIMINNEAGNPIVMGGDDTNGVIQIPSVMISKAEGDKLVEALNTGQVINSTIKAVNGGDFFGYYVLKGNQHVNDIVIRDNKGASEVFIAAGSTFYSDSNPITLLGPQDYGLFKSDNEGSSWKLLGLPLTSGGNRYEPNDLELGADNTLWVATTRNKVYGDGGGTIFSSSNGENFNLAYSFNARRTQIALSGTKPNKIYVLAEGPDDDTPVVMKKTLDGFTTVSDLKLPNDVDSDIDDNDFCRNQAFYNLVIKVDPTNDNKIFVGGIDLFSSSTGGIAWDQITHWYGGFGFPRMHADQHAIVFGNGDTSKMLFGNDGGVYYSSTGGKSPQVRNNGYNVTQFYTIGAAPTSTVQGNYFSGGTQDNGTPYFKNAKEGVSSSIDITGGDGGYTSFDLDGVDSYFIANYVYNNAIYRIDYKTGEKITLIEEDENAGEFINPQALDSRLDYLFSNYSIGTEYAIRTYRTKSTTEDYEVNTLKNGLLDAPALALQISPYDVSNEESILYAGLENGRLLKIISASNILGQTWTDISGSGFVGSVSDIEFGRSTDEMFVTFHNYGVNNIWYTTDGGTTWEQKDGDLPDMPVKAILQNPLKHNEVIIGTELGVWYTTNFTSENPNWKSAFNGMSNVKVTDLVLRDDNTIFASTYGRGIFSGKFTGEALSVEENVLNTGISLFPTVSNGDFNVTSKSNLGAVNLQIFNLNGQSVYVNDLNLSGNASKAININVASGVYLAKFTSGSVSATKKFVIK
ncbi:PA domain-containing protein [Formosa sp. S-31]|uniref:T9SS type A sorting domain-containing protein n=1 Tax=Formosa sp. S-31 TaxID=2790949 RepID=UPI003EBC3C9E